MSSPTSPWASFTHDPRAKENATLRAADRDREVVLHVLAEAYADGRLTREEHDERAQQVPVSRTLGELPALIADLVPVHPEPRNQRAALVRATPEDLRRLAVREWEADRRQALLAFVGSTLVCWAVWLATSFGDGSFDPSFPWPLIVMAATGFHLVRTVVSREELVATEVHRLERRQAKALRGRRGRS